MLNYSKIIFISCWIIIVLIPLPFISNLLIGEEGMFAILAVDNGKDQIIDNHKVLLISRVNGKEQWEEPRHPILPYWVMSKIMRPFSKGNHFKTCTVNEKTRMARLPFYFFYITAWILLFIISWGMLKKKTKKEFFLTLGLIGFIGTWRLMVGGSVQTYYDGNLGVFIVAMVSFGFYLATIISNRLFSYFLLFISGFIAALGKNEWALAFLAANIGVLLFFYIYKYRIGLKNIQMTKNIWIILGLTTLGVFLGSMLHYFIDPFNFIQGYSVMHNFGLKSSANWVDSFLSRLPWIWPLFLMMGLAVPILKKNLKEQLCTFTPQLILLFWGTIMLSGFMITPHLGDGFPRYFCPSMFALLAFFVSCKWDLSSFSKKSTLSIGVFILLMIFFNLIYLHKSFTQKISIGTLSGRSLIQHKDMYKRQYKKFKRTHKPNKVDAALGYYFPEMDFINNT